MTYLIAPVILWGSCLSVGLVIAFLSRIEPEGRKFDWWTGEYEDEEDE